MSTEQTYQPGPHQKRTRESLQAAFLNNPDGDTSEEALWQIAHSLAAIADALTFTQRYTINVDEMDDTARQQFAEIWRDAARTSR